MIEVLLGDDGTARRADRAEERAPQPEPPFVRTRAVAPAVLHVVAGHRMLEIRPAGDSTRELNAACPAQEFDGSRPEQARRQGWIR